MSQIQYKFNKQDEYYTPENAVLPIIKYIPQNSTIWCPFDTKESNFYKILIRNNFNVIATHIDSGNDFFQNDYSKTCDYIISNPPYSLKTEIFSRLFELNKPFAMLINMQGIFDNKVRFNMFKQHEIETMWLSPRVNYIKPNIGNNSGVPFQSAYLCHDMLPKQIIFEEINK